jgi:hypothetical protein
MAFSKEHTKVPLPASSMPLVGCSGVYNKMRKTKGSIFLYLPQINRSIYLDLAEFIIMFLSIFIYEKLNGVLNIRRKSYKSASY